MSADGWCSKPGCERLAIEGHRFCDPCLEAEEERAARVKGVAPPRPKRPRAPSVPREPVTIETRLERCRVKFEHAQSLGDRMTMSQVMYYARRLAANNYLPMPEWATLTWRTTREVRAAAALAARGRLSLEGALEMFRAAYMEALAKIQMKESA